jgi:queuine/archaeosine tRNA-ribosyltransferase
MLDSGGFALLMNPNARWTLREVSTAIERTDADIFVNLDFPPTLDDSAEDRRRKIVKSAKNFDALSARFPNKTIMPVVHGRTFSEIEFSLRLVTSRHTKLRWIGLGGIVPLLQHRQVSQEISSMGAETFISKALTMIRHFSPHANIHAFGAGGTRTFPALFAFGADSADSIGWRQAAGFGSIFLPLKSQRTIKWNESKKAPRKLLDDGDIAQLKRCECPICRSTNSVDAQLFHLRNDFYNRSIHNAWTITHQYKYWPPTRTEMRLFVANGGLGPQWAKACN